MTEENTVHPSILKHLLPSAHNRAAAEAACEQSYLAPGQGVSFLPPALENRSVGMESVRKANLSAIYEQTRYGMSPTNQTVINRCTVCDVPKDDKRHGPCCICVANGRVDVSEAKYDGTEAGPRYSAGRKWGKSPLGGVEASEELKAFVREADVPVQVFDGEDGQILYEAGHPAVKRQT